MVLLLALCSPALLRAQRATGDAAVGSSRFTTIGVAIGTPGSVNATLAWTDRAWTLRGSAGLGGGGRSGAQSALTWRVIRGEQLAVGPALVVGAWRNYDIVDPTATAPTRSTAYIGLAGDAYLDGFRVQIGVGQSGGAHSGRVLIAQAGWEWQVGNRPERRP